MGLGESLGIAVAFSAGLLSFLSPCVLPLFPSYLSLITGMSVSTLAEGMGSETRWKTIVHSLAFIIGFSLVFVALGASFSAAGQLLLDYRDWIRMVGGGFIVVFGLYIAGVLRIGWLSRTKQVQIATHPGSYLGSFAVGVTFAIGWTPCVGPILGSILSLAGTSDTLTTGVGLLVAYSAGLALPFFLSSLALGGFLAFFKRYRPMMGMVERTAGVLLVVVGLLVLTNYFVVLNSYAVSLTPEWFLKYL
ncbi:MAG: cytochrome c biogenesis CcdA family protein [Candidatus Methylomirabilia bacterium]